MGAQTKDNGVNPVYYDFYPRTVLHAGGGFSPSNLSEEKSPCLEPVADFDAHRGPRIASKVYLVQTSADLHSALQMDINIDASYLSFQASAEYNVHQERYFQADTLTAVFHTSAVFPPYRITSIKWVDGTPDIRKTQEFTARCGTYYVQSEERGASVDVIVTLSGVSSGNQNDIATRARESGGAGAFSEAASAAFNAELDARNAEHKVSIEISTTGVDAGKVSKLLEDMAVTPTSVEAIQKAMAETLVGLIQERSVPIGYNVAPFRNLGLKPPSLWSQTAQRLLIDIVDEYRRTSFDLDSAKSITDPSTRDPRALVLNEAQLKEIKLAIPAYRKYLVALSATHEACMKDMTPGAKACELPGSRPPRDLIPHLPAPPKVEYRVITTSGMLDSEKSYQLAHSKGANIAESNRDLAAQIDTFYPGFHDGIARDSAKIVLLVDGDLTRVQLDFEQTTSHPGAPPSQSLGVLPLRRTYDFIDETWVGVGKKIVAFMKEHPMQYGAANGIFYLTLKDRYGRTFRRDLFEASWADPLDQVTSPPIEPKRLTLKTIL